MMPLGLRFDVQQNVSGGFSAFADAQENSQDFTGAAKDCRPHQETKCNRDSNSSLVIITASYKRHGTDKRYDGWQQ